jgi:hypothetical protein
MLTVETISRIRREHFVKGKTIRETSRDLKVSRNTVRKVLRCGGTSFEYEHDVQPRPKLGRWTTELDKLLEGNATKPFWRVRVKRLRQQRDLGFAMTCWRSCASITTPAAGRTASIRPAAPIKTSQPIPSVARPSHGTTGITPNPVT